MSNAWVNAQPRFSINIPKLNSYGQLVMKLSLNGIMYRPMIRDGSKVTRTTRLLKSMFNEALSWLITEI